jgi:hypothetical protein
MKRWVGNVAGIEICDADRLVGKLSEKCTLGRLGIYHYLTALFAGRLWENGGRRVGSHLQPFCCPLSATDTRVPLLEFYNRTHLCWLYPYLLPLLRC